jgi:hypothetical protein
MRNISHDFEMEMMGSLLKIDGFSSCLYGQLMKTFRTVMKTFEMRVE